MEFEKFSCLLLDKTWYDTEAKVKYQAIPCVQFDNIHSTNSVISTSLSTCFFLQISLTNTMDQLPEKVPDLLVRQGIVIETLRMGVKCSSIRMEYLTVHPICFCRDQSLHCIAMSNSSNWFYLIVWLVKRDFPTIHQKGRQPCKYLL